MFAWELGGGLGHIHRLLPVAERLLAAGHHVVLAMRDVMTTERVVRHRPFRLVQAPILGHVPALDLPPVSWADLLRGSGYFEPGAMRFLLATWLALFDRETPDLLVTDFAPAAMLAARIAGLRVVSIGNGWTLPPRTVPLPSIQPWATVPSDVLASADDRAREAVNAALLGFGARPVGTMAALFEGTEEFLCCFPELDHYAGRGEAEYYGAIYATVLGAEPEWPAASGPRVFAYVSTHAARNVVDALATLGWPAVIHAPNTDLGLASGNVWVSPGPVRLDSVFAARPIVVCQGLNLISAALVAGCPLLIIPDHQEQMMLAWRVAERGLGLTAPPGADAETVATLLRRLRDHEGIAARVSAFAASYQGYLPAMPATAIAEEIAGLPE